MRRDYPKCPTKPSDCSLEGRAVGRQSTATASPIACPSARVGSTYILHFMQQDEAIESSIARFIAGCDSGSSSPPNASPALSPRPSSEKPDQSEELTQTSVLGDQAASTTRSTVDTAHFDCAICQGPMIDPAVGGGCAHHFCHPCYVEWALRKASCPTCRAPVWRIIIDNEFAVAGGLERTPMAICVDKMNGSIGTQLQQAIARDRKTVQMDGPAGLSLANTHNGNGWTELECVLLPRTATCIAACVCFFASSSAPTPTFVQVLGCESSQEQRCASSWNSSWRYNPDGQRCRFTRPLHCDRIHRAPLPYWRLRRCVPGPRLMLHPACMCAVTGMRNQRQQFYVYALQ